MGAAAGNIIATIITVQKPRKPAQDKPIVTSAPGAPGMT
jgi:hypothetical protein